MAAFSNMHDKTSVGKNPDQVTCARSSQSTERSLTLHSAPPAGLARPEAPAWQPAQRGILCTAKSICQYRAPIAAPWPPKGNTVTTSNCALRGSSTLTDLHFLRGSSVQSSRRVDDGWL